MLHTNIELFTVQTEGSFDDAGRLRDRYGITIACAGEHQSLWIGAAVPEPLATDLTSVFASAARSNDPAESPRSLEPCRRLLETSDRALQCKAGPNYVFVDAARHCSDVSIERSHIAVDPALREVAASENEDGDDR